MTFTDLLHEAVQTLLAWAHATPGWLLVFRWHDRHVSGQGHMATSYLFLLGALPASYYGGDVLADVLEARKARMGLFAACLPLPYKRAFYRN